MTLGEIENEINDGKELLVHCDTREKAIEFLTMCKSKGFKWKTGIEILGERDRGGFWDDYRNKTSYYVTTNLKYLTYGNAEGAENCYEMYVEFEDVEERLYPSDYDISFLFN